MTITIQSRKRMRLTRSERSKSSIGAAAMAPTKPNTKKKRVGGGPSTSAVPQGGPSVPPGAGSAAVNGPAIAGTAPGGVSETFVSSMRMTLDQAAQYYGLLGRDSRRLRLRLELSLWIYKVVAVVVINLLMYEETVEVPQLASVALTALWLGRFFLLKRLTASSTVPRNRKRFVASRGPVLLGFAGLFIAVHAHYIGKMERDRWTILGVVATLDVISIVNSIFSTHATAALKTTHAIEIVFMTGIFSTQYNHQPYLIYDRVAFFLTIAVSLSHFFVVDGVCNAMFATKWASEEEVSQYQQGRWDAIEEVHKLLDHGMTLKPLTARGKNKEAKEINAVTDDENDLSAQLSIRMDSDVKTELSRCVAAQTVVVAVQLVATSFFLYSWELCSLLMCTSIVLLFDVTRLRWSLEHSNPLPASVDAFLAEASVSAHRS